MAFLDAPFISTCRRGFWEVWNPYPCRLWAGSLRLLRPRGGAEGSPPAREPASGWGAPPPPSLGAGSHRVFPFPLACHTTAFPGAKAAAQSTRYDHLKHTSIHLGNEPQMERAGPGGRGGAFSDPPLDAAPRGMLADSASSAPQSLGWCGAPAVPVASVRRKDKGQLEHPPFPSLRPPPWRGLASAGPHLDQPLATPRKGIDMQAPTALRDGTERT